MLPAERLLITLQSIGSAEVGQRHHSVGEIKKTLFCYLKSFPAALASHIAIMF